MRRRNKKRRKIRGFRRNRPLTYKIKRWWRNAILSERGLVISFLLSLINIFIRGKTYNPIIWFKSFLLYLETLRTAFSLNFFVTAYILEEILMSLFTFFLIWFIIDIFRGKKRF